MTSQVLIALGICLGGLTMIVVWGMWLYNRGYELGAAKQREKDEKEYKERLDGIMLRYSNGDPGYRLRDGDGRLQLESAGTAGGVDATEGCGGGEQGAGDTVPVYDKG